MRSPLKADNELVAEFKIDPKSDLDITFKLGYLRTQIDEFKKAMYRNRVDALISLDLMERANKVGDESMEAKARENLTNYRNFIKQTAGALKFLESYKNELEPLAKDAEQTAS